MDLSHKTAENNKYVNTSYWAKPYHDGYPSVILLMSFCHVNFCNILKVFVQFKVKPED